MTTNYKTALPGRGSDATTRDAKRRSLLGRYLTALVWSGAISWADLARPASVPDRLLQVLSRDLAGAVADVGRGAVADAGASRRSDLRLYVAALARDGALEGGADLKAPDLVGRLATALASDLRDAGGDLGRAGVSELLRAGAALLGT